MSRVWSSGFELQSVAALAEWNAVSGSPAISTSVKRSGAASLHISSLVSGTKQGLGHRFRGADSDNAVYARFYLYVTTFPSADNFIVAFSNGSFGAATGAVKLTSAGTLKLFEGTTEVGTSSTVVAASTWYRVELLMDRAASPNAGSDVATLRINGVDEVTSSALSMATAATWILVGANLAGETQTQGEWYFDDIAVNDDQGSVQNSWPGAGSIVHLRPSGAGEFAEPPVTGAGTAHEALDETTPDDATSYVTFEDTSGDWSTPDRLMVACQNPSDVGIQSIDTVTLVQVGATVAMATASQGTYIVALQTQNGGTKAEGSAIDIAATSWTFIDDSEAGPRIYSLTSFVDPQDSAAWTPSKLDSLQIGARASDATPDVLMTAIWALVEYVAGVAGNSARIRIRNSAAA